MKIKPKYTIPIIWIIIIFCTLMSVSCTKKPESQNKFDSIIKGLEKIKI